ncbi:SDR family oxidoreductase [Agromyces italicus]|uniref:SDR family oxidoreductase n=1 Tax=Agromyces italicus TaxID=279572 RepID=UPI0003B4DC2F|nr:SDR family oxidoreductase [Agromyces italicus]
MNEETESSPPLVGRRTVVLGGTGSVGEHFVRAHLSAGADVIVPSRTEARAALLRDDPVVRSLQPGPRMLVGDYVSFAGAESTAEVILAEHGPVDHVVATLGSWWSGAPFWGVDETTWQRYFIEVTSAYAAAARAWLPRLSPDGTLQLVIGASGVVPVPGASVISMAQSSLVMMRRVIAEEAGDARRVFSIVLGNLNLRRRGWRRPDFVDADDATTLSVALAHGAQRSAEFVLRRPEQAKTALAELSSDVRIPAHSGRTPAEDAS